MKLHQAGYHLLTKAGNYRLTWLFYLLKVFIINKDHFRPLKVHGKSMILISRRGIKEYLVFPLSLLNVLKRRTRNSSIFLAFFHGPLVAWSAGAVTTGHGDVDGLYVKPAASFRKPTINLLSDQTIFYNVHQFTVPSVVAWICFDSTG